MDWVPSEMWLTYLQVDAPAADLDYDLAVSASPGDSGRLRRHRSCRRPRSIRISSGAFGLWPIVAADWRWVVVLTIGLSRRKRGIGVVTGRLP